MHFLAGKDEAADAVALAGNLTRDALTKLRDALKAEKDWSSSSAPSCAMATSRSLVDFGLAQGAKFICLGDYANSRGAADMGLVSRHASRLRSGGQRDQVPRGLARRDSEPRPA